MFFCYGSLLISDYISLIDTELFKLFSRAGFGKLCLSRSWSISSRLSNWQTQSCSYSIHIPFNVFNTHRMCRDASSFIFDINNLYSLFLLISLARILLILLVFSKNQLWVSLIIICWFPMFSFTDLCSISFVLILDLIFSSFLVS